MHARICTVMLALAYNCYSLPKPWDTSKIRQAVLGVGEDLDGEFSACTPPTSGLGNNELSKGDGKGRVYGVACALDQSNSALSRNMRHSLIIKVSVELSGCTLEIMRLICIVTVRTPMVRFIIPTLRLVPRHRASERPLILDGPIRSCLPSVV
jgi:hypothetical protein